MPNKPACGILLAAIIWFLLGLQGCTTKRDAKESQSETRAAEPEQSYTEKEYAKRYSEGYEGQSADNINSEHFMPFLFSFPKNIPRFPWPPPRASNLVEVPVKVDNIETLGDLDNVLQTALDSAGYVESNYYAIPDGFALATRMEQIRQDGTPVDPGRWKKGIQLSRHFTLKDYFRALFTSNPGRFRIIVFAVTDVPVTQKDIKVSQDEASGWVSNGADRLPENIKQIKYSNSYQTDALIYEFEKLKGKPAVIKVPSGLTGIVHLRNSGILSKIQ